jgi:hypothetical protein
MYGKAIKVMYVSMNIIEKIKNVIEKISEDFPINSDKFVEMFNDLTSCEIVYDVFAKNITFLKLNKRFELRIYRAKDKVYCIENGVEKEYLIRARVTDIFDKQRTVSIVLDYKVFRIEQIR